MLHCEDESAITYPCGTANTLKSYFAKIVRSSSPSNLSRFISLQLISLSSIIAHPDLLCQPRHWLNASTAISPDNIQPLILKECADALTNRLYNLFKKDYPQAVSHTPGKIPPSYWYTNVVTDTFHLTTAQ